MDHWDEGIELTIYNSFFPNSILIIDQTMALNPVA